MGGAGAAAFSFTIVNPQSVRGTQANSKITLGLIGCGGRGIWIANLYQNGAVRNIATFAENIGKSDFSNATVPPSVRSNLTTILGRTAAYRRREVTWDEMMRENESLDPLLAGLKG